MYNIHKKFVIFQIIFCIISLIIMCITPYLIHSTDSLVNILNRVADNFESASVFVIMHAWSIVASILCNIVHLCNIREFKESYHVSTAMIIIVIMSAASLPFLCFMDIFYDLKKAIP